MNIDLQAALRPAFRFGKLFNLGLYGVVTLALFTIAATIISPNATGETLAEFANVPPEGITTTQTFILVALLLIHITLWTGVFAAGRELCRQLEHGSIAGAALRADRLANWLWALLLWSVFGQAITSAAVSWHMIEGERFISIGVGPLQISVALAALMAVFLARAFSVGAELWQDHREIV